MAREERKKEDLFIKKKRRASNFFVTSSAKMDEEDGANKTTISSSVFTEMKRKFDDGEYLTDNHSREMNGGILYMMQQMQEDIDDVYNEVSASAFEASYFPFATMDSASFGIVSSSLIPDADDTHDLGSSGKEWKDLYIDGTANVDVLNINGTNVVSTAAELNYSTNVTSDIQTQLNAKIALSGGAFTGRISTRLISFANGDGTPTVAAANVFQTANKGATAISKFDDGLAGQEITIIFQDANTTLLHGGARAARDLFLQKARNAAFAGGDTITLVCNGKNWYETSRSDNT